MYRMSFGYLWCLDWLIVCISLFAMLCWLFWRDDWLNIVHHVCGWHLQSDRRFSVYIMPQCHIFCCCRCIIECSMYSMCQWDIWGSGGSNSLYNVQYWSVQQCGNECLCHMPCGHLHAKYWITNGCCVSCLFIRILQLWGIIGMLALSGRFLRRWCWSHILQCVFSGLLQPYRSLCVYSLFSRIE